LFGNNRVGVDIGAVERGNQRVDAGKGFHAVYS
jgi:hypothetical protein